jgi:putative hydrolase of the HAD superfamily
MHERLGISKDEIPALRTRYLETYGTTLRGLQHSYEIDTEDYLAYVHNLPLERYLAPNPELRQILLNLPLKRWIFTNSDDNHAHRVMNLLNVSDCFHGIIDVRVLGFINKPDPLAYQIALKTAGESMPERCILIDDSPRNLAPAKMIGFTTVLVSNRLQDASADHVIPRINDLKTALPVLWRNGGSVG